ncbi:MAG: hypothetical protein KatS3mg089_0026 [Patescibacteria group bacterium]|nr:MAG: hypothetical protein KatS3mg089_0026 [Patescibacteria group bacterium]
MNTERIQVSKLFDNLHNRINRREFFKSVAAATSSLVFPRADAEEQLLSQERELSFRDTNAAIIFVAQWINDVSSAGYVIDGDESTYGRAWNNSSDEMRNLLIYPPAEARIREIGNVVGLDDGRFKITAKVNGLFDKPSVESTLNFIVSKEDTDRFQMDWSEPIDQTSSLVFPRADAEEQLLSQERELSFRDTNAAIIFVAQWINDVSSAGYVIDGDESTYGRAWNNSSDEMRNLLIYPPAEARIREIGNVVGLDDGRFKITAKVNGLFDKPSVESTLNFIVSKEDTDRFQMDWSEPLS